MKRRYAIHFILFFIILLLVGCGEQAPRQSNSPVAATESVLPTAVEEEMADGGSIKDGELTATVFVDENVNGRFDPNEPIIPNTFVVGQRNMFGEFMRTAALTDEDGKMEFSGEYSDIFEVVVIPPCNHEATTAVKLSIRDADENGNVEIGFRPESDEWGMAEVQVQLWQDDYADGVVGDGERPLVDTTVNFNPNLKKLDINETYTGLLTTQTDADGIATVQLGNGCDVVWIDALAPSRITKIRPAATFEEGKIGFDYADGLLEVRMGFAGDQPEPEPASITLHQFTFENGSPEHPESFGEWHFLLDSGGYFKLRQILYDVENLYGITTLLPTQNEQLWQLIEAANLGAIPSSTDEAEPDAVMYTFTLTEDNETKKITLLATEAQENEAIMALLDGLATVVKSHTGEDVVLR